MPLQSDPHHRKVHHSRWTFGRSAISTRAGRRSCRSQSYGSPLSFFCRPLEADAYHLLTTLMCGVYAFGIAEIAKAYSAALNNQKSCVVSLPEPLSPQRYHKPSPGRIGCEECCCHLTTSYLVGVRDYGGRHDRCSGRRHQGKHQSEENKELAHVSLTCHCFAALWRRRTDRSICVRSTNEDEIVEASDNVE